MLLSGAVACAPADLPIVSEPIDCAPFAIADQGSSGCHGAYCATCTSSASCADLEACVGGTCGACSDDPECGTGRRCASGYCVSPPRVFELGIARTDLAILINDPYNEVFVPCTLAADGVRYDEGCRIRLRGGTSRDFPKKSFRITYPSGARHPGYSRKINLRAEYNDPTFLRNFLGLEILRRFTRVPAPRVRFVRLVLNGEVYGLMAEVERIGDNFLEHNGRSTVPALYEADPTRDLFAANACSLIPLPSAAEYQEAYVQSNGTPGDYSDLISFIEADLNKDYEEGPAGQPSVTTRTTAAIHLEALIDYLAVMAVLQSQDHVRKNYYLSRQDRGWEMYPWDLDLTFGCLYDNVGMNTLCDRFVTDAPVNAGVIPAGTPITYPAEGHLNLLIHLLWNDPHHSQIIRCRACAISESRWWTERLPELIVAMRGALAPVVEEDAKDRNATRADFDRAIAELETFVPLRAAEVSRQLGCR